jgi:hypothetical protein
MSCDTVKYKVIQNPVTKTVSLEIYRPYGINNEWMRVDILNELTVNELKSLTQYLINIFNKTNK